MKSPFLFILVIWPLLLKAQHNPLQKDETYQVFINLSEVQNDQLQVEIIVPPIENSSAEYIIPKIVPGTYSISDFGRFISEFKAFDTNGTPLSVDSIGINQFQIRDAHMLKKISYKVDDTFDSNLNNPIFEPAGTNIEVYQNFLLNTFGFIGYLQGLQDKYYELTIKHSPDLYGATSLKRIYTDPEIDIFRSKNYLNLSDSPIMYCKPDTSHLVVGGADILVSVYSPKRLLTSAFVMENVKEMLMAQKEYLGGSLPVDRYTFIIYLSPKKGVSGSWGALEHSYSSVYFLPEANPNALVHTIRNVSAHEFFHIVTPLSIHSEEIHYFDFLQPKMSEHLWLYEGVTEYSAGNMQVKYKLIDLNEYLAIIRGKMNAADRYNDTLPFTIMSKGCLYEYPDQYQNVYQKGALIGMCLDLKLIELSDGTYNLQALLRDLAKNYGPHKPFKDEELFAKIEELTFPEIGYFLNDYVSGEKKLPYGKTLAAAGINYVARKKNREITLGKIPLSFNPETQRVYIRSLKGANEFAQKIKYKQGDELISLNGIALEPDNLQEALSLFKKHTKEGDRVIIMVARKNKKGVYKSKRLKAKAMAVDSETRNFIELMNNPSEEQLAIRKTWTNH